jgi:hypothetical protein
MSEDVEEAGGAYADLKNLFDIAKSAVGIIAVVGGAIWGVIEYHNKVVADRVKETLAMVERFHKAPFNDAYARINSVWSANEGKAAEIATDPKKVDAFVISVINENKLDDPLITMFDFFREVQVCVDRKICDREVANAFFLSEARAIYHTNYAFIAANLTLWNDTSFAAHLQDFASGTK